MKTVKFLSVLIATALFTISSANAQPKNYSKTTVPVSFFHYCGNEVVEGTRTMEMRWNSNSIHLLNHTSMVGQETGAQYEAKAVINLVDIDNDQNEANVYNVVWHFVIKRDNIPIGQGHVNGHVTINANGVPTVQFTNDEEWVCRL
jgi:hypothetical protein